MSKGLIIPKQYSSECTPYKDIIPSPDLNQRCYSLNLSRPFGISVDLASDLPLLAKVIPNEITSHDWGYLMTYNFGST